MNWPKIRRISFRHHLIRLIGKVKKTEEGADGHTGKGLFGMFRGLEKTLA